MEIKEAIGVTLFESEKFGGEKFPIGGIAPTLRSEKVCAGVVEVKKINVAGSLEMEGWHRLANEVLFTDGISTAVTCQSNNLIKKIVEVRKVDIVNGENTMPKSNRATEQQSNRATEQQSNRAA